jgi:glycosyltransferase involved in cell wall biosynthesis
MRILMLGWEFPPFISGGLGTACYGLTRALAQAGHEVTFVLPKPVDPGARSHIRLVSPESPAPAPQATPEHNAPTPAPRRTPERQPGEHTRPAPEPVAPPAVADAFEQVRFVGLPAILGSPYGEQAPGAGEASWSQVVRQVGAGAVAPTGPMSRIERSALHEAGLTDETIGRLEMHRLAGGAIAPAAGEDYSGDVLFAAARYADMALALCAHERFDVIHAHDWMTYPAGVALARATGKPLVCHIHSTEFDRSGEHVNQRIYNIERAGMHAADKVIAVSFLTRSICERRYAVPSRRLRVVYNGVETEGAPQKPLPSVEAGDKIVLFLGRITMQKGPEYFIAAAQRVLEKMENVKFVVAGSGDMVQRMIELAAQMGIGHKVLFTGFLRGGDVARVFRMADCYVMPSVSEPFGIAPLEAMSHDVPAIISRQSGVSEVLTHCLKVDFWDIDAIADRILAVLRHAPLSRTLRQHGALEVRRLTWEGAATKCAQVYAEAMADKRSR